MVLEDKLTSIKRRISKKHLLNILRFNIINFNTKKYLKKQQILQPTETINIFENQDLEFKQIIIPKYNTKYPKILKLEDYGIIIHNYDFDHIKKLNIPKSKILIYLSQMGTIDTFFKRKLQEILEEKYQNNIKTEQIKFYDIGTIQQKLENYYETENEENKIY